MAEIEITLSISQIINLCEFAGLKVEENEEIDKDTELTIIEDRKSIIAYYSEYPNEGGFEL